MCKYTVWYNKLISSRKVLFRERSYGEYFENHHILPRCLGGKNNEENLILLTGREHFIAHVLLAKMYKDTKHYFGLLNALNQMARHSPTHNKERYVNSRLYEFLKKKWSILSSERMKKNNPNKNGLSQEHKDKISKSLAGRVFTIKHKENISKSTKGRQDFRTAEDKAIAAEKASKKLKGMKKPPGFGEAVGDRLRGKTMSDSAKQKMKNSWTLERRLKQAEIAKLQNKNRPVLICPHCNKQGTNPGNMYRYHFEKCNKAKV